MTGMTLGQRDQPLHIGLFFDRLDWILGTVAQQIVRVLRQPDHFRYHLGSYEDLLRSPIPQIRAFRSCDLVHWLVPSGFTAMGSLLSDRPQVCTINHCIASDGYSPEQYRDVRVLTMSRASWEQLNARDFTQIDIVHYGIDPVLFHPLSKLESRKQLGIETSRPLVGFFAKESSNPGDRKGTKVLAESLELLNARHPVALLLSGDGWGEMRQVLESKRVEVYQRSMRDLAQMPVLYGALDLYLCTSRIEGGPMPVLEAMACGRPVVSTPVGHVPEVIRHRENGMIIPIDQPVDAAAAVEQVLVDEAFANRIASAGRRSILAGWTWDKTLAPLAEIYREVALSKGCKFHRTEKLRAGLLLVARSLKYRWVHRHPRGTSE